MAIWFVRWVDRLDLNGVCYVGRHYLTLARDYESYGDSGYSSLKYAEHMRPLLRRPEEINNDRTILEHLRMFLESQNNNSIYGRFDCGSMIHFRDKYKESLQRIIDSAQTPKNFTPLKEKQLLDWLTNWLSQKIKPSESGRRASLILKEKFQNLPPDTKKKFGIPLLMLFAKIIMIRVTILKI